MFYLLAFIIAIAAAFLVLKRSTAGKTKDQVQPSDLVAPVLTFIGIMFVFFIQPYNCELIDAGNVGIKISKIGDNRGVGNYEYKSGYVFYNQWTSRVEEISITQQQAHYENQQVTTYGGFVANIKPSFNYSVKAGNAGDMYVNLRKPLKQIEDEWLSTAVVTAINDVSNRWKIDSIFTRRQEFEANIQLEINKKVGKWFTISQLRTNMIPPAALVNAINAKTQATQEVQVAEQRKKVAQAEGITKRAEAQADSIVLVTRAAAEARANQLKQAVLTPMLLKQQWISAWEKGGSQVPTFISGSTQGMIFQMPADK